MPITAKFDLDAIHLDATNAHINARLDEDEEVYVKRPPGFNIEDDVLCFARVLYGLRRSPILWYKGL